MSNVSDFIKQLEAVNESNLVSISVPSHNFKKYKFRALSVKQHKDLLKAAMSGFEGNLKAAIIYNNIIKDNCSENIEFKMYDKQYILTQLRKSTIGATVVIDDKNYNINDLPEFKYQVEPPREFTYKNITVQTCDPSLDDDTHYMEKCFQEISKMPNSDAKIAASMPVLITYEIVKYIDTVQVEEVVLPFSSITLHDRKNIIDNLPLKLNNMITDYITQIKEAVTNQFVFSDNVSLPFDPSFLTSE
jgi:hypothetical protein